MGFFSELKNDLSQAVNTLMPDDKSNAASLDSSKADKAFADKPEKVDIDTMLNRLEDIKIEESAPEENGETEAEKAAVEEQIVVEPVVPVVPEPVVEEVKEEPKSALETIAELKKNAAEADELKELEEKIEEQTLIETKAEEPLSAIEAISEAHVEEYAAETVAATSSTNNSYNGGYETMDFEQLTPTDEIASITEGMVICGDIQTTGSLDLIGKVTGNIKSLGKLNITGEIVGDSDAAEIYAESARITGEVRSKGSVKVGQSTVIVGNIFGSSAVIAGAVKGDIDVHGPVVLDTTAIVMGNIKSQSVQINNGAVIEGMCSQAYADVNPSEFFETLKNK